MKQCTFFFFLFTLCFSLFTPATAFAKTPSGNTISVTPSIIQLDLRTSTPEATLTYMNTTSDTVQLSLSARDFTNLAGLEDNGQMGLLGSSDTQTYHYRLSSWVHFDTNSLVLLPGEKQTVHITIEKEALPIGGHYTAIMATVSPKQTTHPIKIQPVLASLLFVRTGSAYDREEAKISAVTITRFFPYFPQHFLLRIENTGNVQLTPYGLIQITDPFGHLVAKGILNEDSLLLLPESFRSFTVPIRQIQPFLWPGMYHASVQMRYANDKPLVRTDLTFFSQGTIDFVKTGTGLIIFLLGFLLYRKWKRRTK